MMASDGRNPLVKTKPGIRLLIVDDHPTFREGLAALLEREADMSVVALTGDGREAVKLFRSKRPDIVLMDLRLPGLSGVEAIMALRAEHPDCRVIVVTTYDADEDIYRAMQSGARSFLLKDMSREEILETIRSVHAGKSPLPQSVAGLLAERLKREGLSRRETELLQLLVKGRSNKEIATALSLPETTVKFYLRGLFMKLGAQDRTEAVVSALRHGIVHLE